MKRLFIAINLPLEIKREIAQIKEELEGDFEKGVKWVKNENLHITVCFLGDVKEGNLNELKNDLSQLKVGVMKIDLNRIRYVPDRRKAKLIWIEGVGEGVKKLKNKIDNILINSKVLNYQPDERDFILHVTLGRTKSFEYRSIPLEEIPLLEDEPHFSFTAASFELMESKLKKGGPEYKIINSYE